MLVSLGGLENLLSAGEVEIKWNQSLEGLDALGSLEEVNGNIRIYGNPELVDLEGLNGLSSVQASLELAYWDAVTGPVGNPQLQNLSGLQNISNINGYLVIAGCNSLVDLSGLESLTTVGGVISIYGNETLGSLSGLDNLSSVGSGIYIGTPFGYGNPTLTSLDGLQGLHIISGYLEIRYNDALLTLTGLEGLETTGGNLFIGHNNSLYSLNGLNNLVSIGGDVSIGAEYYPNPSLQSLSGLGALSTIGGALSIVANYALPDLSGLQNIQPASINSLAITHNNLLSECDVQSICAYLANPGGSIEIHDNAPGCNSPEEVEDACLSAAGETIAGGGMRIIPNPSNDIITVSVAAITGIMHLSVFIVSGEKVIDLQLTNNRTQIDISALPRGVYFVRVQDEKTMKVEKMIKQ